MTGPPEPAVLPLLRGMVVLTYLLLLLYLRIMWCACQIEGWHALSTWRRILKTIWHVMQSHASLFRSCGGESRNPFHEKVRESVAVLRVERIQKTVGVIVHFVAATIVYYFCRYPQLSSWQLWVGGETEFESENIYIDALPGFLFYFMICLVVMTWPKLLYPRSIDLVFAAACLWQIHRCMRSFDASVPELVHIRVLPELMISRFILGLLVCNVRVTSVCNVFTTVAIVLATVKHPMRGLEEATHGIVVRQIFWGVAFTILWGAFEKWTWTQVKCQLEVRVSSQAVSIVHRLLVSLCDAVVVLRGEDFRMDEPAPKLAAMLLKQGSTDLKGALFLDLVSETDQARVRNFLERPLVQNDEVSSQPAGALQVNLQDQNGSCVKAQLFHCSFTDIYDKCMHMIGICQIGDKGAVPDTTHEQSYFGSVDALNIRSVSELSADTSAQSTLSPLNENVSLIVDAMSLKMLDCTSDPGFGRLLAELHEGRKFVDLLTHSSTFVTWAQQLTLKMFHSVEPHSGQSKAVTLRSRKAVLRTICTIRPAWEPEEVEEKNELPSELPVCIVLSSFRRKQSRSESWQENMGMDSGDVQSELRCRFTQ